MSTASAAVSSVALALVVSMPAVQEEAERPVWLGCWGDGEWTLLFESERAGRLVGDEPQFFRLQEVEGRLWGEAWGRLTWWTVRAEGDGLRVEQDGETRVLARLDEVPEALRVLPYPLVAPAELDVERRDSIAAELVERGEADQRVRHEAESSGFDERTRGEMRAIDEANTDRLRERIAEVGWIDRERFGADAAGAAFLIAQHSADMRLQRTALPRIHAEVLAGTGSGQEYALLYDRLQLNLGFRTAALPWSS